MAAAALIALCAAASECAAAAGRFSPEQCAEGVALAQSTRLRFCVSHAGLGTC